MSGQAASAAQSVVIVVDDDSMMRDAMSRLFRSVGHRVETFSSAQDLLKSKLPDLASCLVLDVRMPGLSGFDLQVELAKANIRVPIIFITGHGDIPMSVRAMKAGAVNFLNVLDSGDLDTQTTSCVREVLADVRFGAGDAATWRERIGL